jgi:hypothetical protein
MTFIAVAVLLMAKGTKLIYLNVSLKLNSRARCTACTGLDFYKES